MATIYITSNASSGDGTLRAALSNASSGDVIQPDPSVFPSGSPCIIVISDALTFPEGVTVDGAQTSITISGTGGSMTVMDGAVLRRIDFLQYLATTSTGFLWIRSAATFENCSFCGNTAGRSVFFVRSNASVDCLNCYFAGNRGVNEVAVIYLADETSAATLTNCTIVGNVSSTGAQWNREPTLVDCKTDDDGLVAPPPTGWSFETWTAEGWQNWNPHILTASEDARGYNSVGARYDVEGNPRINGTLGAFETIDADLYWIGKDANGDDVATPSFESTEGWADDRWATTSGAVLPSSVSSLYVGEEDVAFSGTWTPTDGEFIIGRGDVSATFGDEVKATVGLGTLTYSGDVVVGDEDDEDAPVLLDSFVPVAPATLDARAYASAESFVVPSGVTVKIDEGEIGALTMNGGELVVAQRLTVVDSLTLTSGNITLNNESALLYAGAATVSGGTLSALSRGYFAVPSTTDTSAATFDGVTILKTDVNGSNFRVDTTHYTAHLSWTADLPTVLETVAPFSLISSEATLENASTQIITKETQFRLWTGDEWQYATAVPRVDAAYWTVENWGTVKADVADVAYNVNAWGLAPNVTHTATTETVTETETTEE